MALVVMTRGSHLPVESNVVIIPMTSSGLYAKCITRQRMFLPNVSFASSSAPPPFIRYFATFNFYSIREQKELHHFSPVLHRGVR